MNALRRLPLPPRALKFSLDLPIGNMSRKEKSVGRRRIMGKYRPQEGYLDP